MVYEKVITNPFPGLRAFEEDEDVLFFGREKQIDELLKKLRTSRFLAIIGSSGSGKSSLVKSGLLPSLHSGLMSGVSSDWRIALFRPGNDPIGQLNLALSQDGVLRDYDSNDDLQIYTSINESILRRSNLGLTEVYKQSGVDKKHNLLVLVDQFEEIFRFSKYEKEAGEGKRDSIAFINLLLKAAEQKEFPIYVVFTMRSDFLGDCTEFRGLPEAINEGQYLVPRMTREERREAITGPIAVGNGAITPALLNRLLNDVGDNPDQLPILQHAMMRTWDEWKIKKHPEVPIDINDYESIGTISEALSQHAEEAYAELATERDREICEKIFKELTDRGSLAYGIRRPRLLSELCAAADATPAEVISVIEVFRKPGRGFLMPAAPAPLTEKSIIDISHESLMRVWKRLITWLEEEDESAQVYLHLCEAVNLYEAGKGGLWRDPELQIAIKWKEEQNTNAAWASRYNNYYEKVMFFLEHSRQQRDLEVKHKEELQKQRLRITRRVSIVVSIVAFLAFILAIVSFSLSNKAKRAQVLAVSEKKEALTEKKRADSSAANALNEKQTALAAEASAKKSEQFALEQKSYAVVQEGIAKKESNNAKIAEADARSKEQLARQKEAEAKKSEQNAIDSKNREEHAKVQALEEKDRAIKLQKRAESKTEAHQAQLYVNDKEYQQCLQYALSAYTDNKENGGSFQDNDIYHALYLSWVHSIDDRNEDTFHSYAVRSIAALPNADYIFSGDEGGTIITSHDSMGILKVVSAAKMGMEARALAVSPDGQHLLAVSSKQAIVYKIKNNITLEKMAVVNFTGIGRHGSFSENGYFVVQSSAGLTRFNMNSLQPTGDFVGINNCSALAVSKTGKIYVGAAKNIYGYAGWEAIRNTPSQAFQLLSSVTALCVDATGRYLAAGTYDGGVWLDDLSGDDKPGSSTLHHSSVNDMKFAREGDGKLQLATASSDKTLKLIEVEDGKLNTGDVITLEKHSSWVYAVCYTGNGKYLFSGSEDHLILGWPPTMARIYNTLTQK